MRSRLSEVLSRRAQATPERLAYRFLPQGELEDAVEVTYAALAERVEQLASVFVEQVEPGARALLLFEPGIEFVAAFVAGERAGVVTIPVPPVDPNRAARYMPRLRGILADARPALVLGEPGQLAVVQEGVDPRSDLVWVSSHDRPVGYRPPVERTEDDAVFLQYTSGSTGRPKGVVATERSLSYTLRDFSAGFGPAEPDPHMVSWLPQFHDMGLIAGLLHPLIEGYPCTFMPPTAFLADPSRWLRAIGTLAGTRSAAPDFGYRLCSRRISDEALEGLDLCGWALALNAAEPIRDATLTRFVERFAPVGFRAEAFCGGYGLAEATVKVSTGVIGRWVPRLVVDRDALERRIVVPSADGVTLVSSGRLSLQTVVRVAHV